MAIGTPALENSFGDSTDAASWASGSFTVSADDAVFLFAAVANTGASTDPPTITSITDGTGVLSFSEVTTHVYYIASSFNRMRLYAYKAVASGGATGTITVNLSGTAGGLHGVIVSVTGCNTTDPVTQSKTGSGSAATSGSVTFDASGSLPILLALAHRSNEFATLGAGMDAELYDAGMASPAHALQVSYSADFVASPGGSWSTSTEYGIIAIELAEPSADTDGGELMLLGVG